MAGLVPAIQVVQPKSSLAYGWRPIGKAFQQPGIRTTWMAGTSPAMTEIDVEITGCAQESFRFSLQPR